jgi:hypothetical protein
VVGPTTCPWDLLAGGTVQWGFAVTGELIGHLVGGIYQPSSRPVGHHTVPRAVLSQLDDSVRAAIQDRAGAPNIWPIPEDMHIDIHRGARG